MLIRIFAEGDPEAAALAEQHLGAGVRVELNPPPVSSIHPLIPKREYWLGGGSEFVKRFKAAGFLAPGRAHTLKWYRGQYWQHPDYENVFCSVTATLNM